jgi:hypothetical protein
LLGDNSSSIERVTARMRAMGEGEGAEEGTFDADAPFIVKLVG